MKTWSSWVHPRPDVQSVNPLEWEDHDREVVRVLASLARCATCRFRRGAFPVIRGGKATIIWHSAEQARPLLEDAVESYVKECVQLIGALHETIPEFEIRSKVRIWLSDGRRVQTSPIPSAGMGVEFNRCAYLSSNVRCVD